MTRPSVVLDTNIVVSAHLSPKGIPMTLLDLALAGRVDLYVSPAILDEYEGVMRRGKFRFHPRVLERSLRDIRETAILVHPRIKLSVCKDPKDNMFVECAEAASADVLITGNLRDFPNHWKQTKIVNP